MRAGDGCNDRQSIGRRFHVQNGGMVDLEGGNWELRQLAQRRIVGDKIVERASMRVAPDWVAKALSSISCIARCGRSAMSAADTGAIRAILLSPAIG